MKLKKMLAWLMTLCMMATVLPVTVLAADEQYQAVADKGTENEKYYETLQEALKDAGAANAGNTTIDILCETIDGSDWEAVKVDGYHGADIVTLNGNGATITGMKQPLFAGGFAGGSGIVINDLTIANSEIVSTNSTGSGAFIESMDSMDKIVLYNCHLKDTSVEGSRTGGLIGWTSGYNNVNDGPVKTYVTITGCSVINCEITGTSVGAINGHAGANAWTYTTIEDCLIEDVNLISTDDGDWRVGVVLGTANVGEVTINNIEYDDIFMTQKAEPIYGQTDLVGRAVLGETGKLTIDGEAYNKDCKLVNPVKIEDGGKYETLADALKAAENGDNIILLQDIAVTSAIDFKGKDVVIKGATKDVAIDFTAIAEYAPAGTNYHANGITFKDMTLVFANKNYIGFHHDTVERYIGCVIEGQPFLYSPEAIFKGCTFKQTSSDAYNVWTYGAKDVTFEECTFNSAGKA
ncbi:MAG: hypothetical protein IJM95_10250, partial [Anaerotignum sp.]|nr:hypothetical protein [Anaerotignum sp.]